MLHSKLPSLQNGPSQFLSNDSGRSMQPPAFQLKADPIQRVVVNDAGNPVQWDELVDYVVENSIDVRFDDLEAEYLKESKVKQNHSIEWFLDKKLGVDMSTHEPDKEELKKIPKRGGGAPKEVREEVYSEDHPNFIDYCPSPTHGTDSIRFTCGDCDQDLYVHEDTGHESGFFTSNSGRQQKPPVCHSSEYPANELIEEYGTLVSQKLKVDLVSLNHSDIFKSIKKKVEWNFDLGGMYPGHTRCNSRKKDKPFNQTQKRNLRSELNDYLRNEGDWKKLEEGTKKITKVKNTKRKRKSAPKKKNKKPKKNRN